MKLLPEVTALPGAPQRRRHAPAQGRYGTFRDCLRWDFGFTCALCLLHEADLTELGAEGEGLIWAEHIEPRSARPELEDRYDNCVLSCRHCNNARAAAPREDEFGRELLDPTAVPWADHFSLDDDGLKPVPGDAGAEYTWRIYRLGDAKKTERRSRRRELMRRQVEALKLLPQVIERLLEAAERAHPEERVLRLAEARHLKDQLQAVRRDLRRFAAVPVDAPTRCRCPSPGVGGLPSWLDDQTREVSGL